MAYHPNYHRCMRGIGRPCSIRTNDGRVYRGIITRVTPTHVYIRGFQTPAFRGGFGYGYYPGWGFGAGFVTGIALSAIVALAFFPFWW